MFYSLFSGTCAPSLFFHVCSTFWLVHWVCFSWPRRIKEQNQTRGCPNNPRTITVWELHFLSSLFSIQSPISCRTDESEWLMLIPTSELDFTMCCSSCSSTDTHSHSSRIRMQSLVVCVYCEMNIYRALHVNNFFVRIIRCNSEVHFTGDMFVSNKLKILLYIL